MYVCDRSPIASLNDLQSADNCAEVPRPSNNYARASILVQQHSLAYRDRKLNEKTFRAGVCVRSDDVTCAELLKKLVNHLPDTERSRASNA